MSSQPIGRQIPASIDIEANMLGCVLLDPSLLEENPPVKPSDFFYDSHANIWHVISDLLKRGREPIEPAVRDEIVARGWQDKTQGRDAAGTLLFDCAYLAHLVSVAYTPAFNQSIAKVLELSRCRRGIKACGQITGGLQAGLTSSMEILATGISELTAILESADPPERAATLSQLAQDEAKRLVEAYTQSNPKVSSVSTGFRWLDEALGGWQAGDLITIGARPSTGKTRIASYMLAAAAHDGHCVGMISLDMNRQRLLRYIIPTVYNIANPGNPISGKDLYSIQVFGEFERARIEDVCGAVDPDGRYLVIDEPRRNDMAAISAYIRILALRGVQVLCLDQVQNISEWSQGSMNRGIYSAVYGGLKLLARRYGVAVIALHQIQREGAARPEMKHLKDSGVPEEFSDVVLLLHDYQAALISEYGGFVNDGARDIAPKTDTQRAAMICEATARRMISVHLAKSRSSSAQRKDVLFDYSLGIKG